jgi:hypothetical protein
MDSDGVLEEDTNAGTTSGKDFWLHRGQKIQDYMSLNLKRK